MEQVRAKDVKCRKEIREWVTVGEGEGRLAGCEHSEYKKD